MAGKGRAGPLADFLTGVMGQHPTRVGAFLDSLDPASAARLAKAAEAGDTQAILKAMSEQTWGTAPGRAAPKVEVTPGGRSPMSFEDRVLNDPNIRSAVEASGAQVPAGDVEAMLDAYRGAKPKRGRPKTVEDSIREMAKEPTPQENIAQQFERATDIPTRQAELPFGESRQAIPDDMPPPEDPGGLPAGFEFREPPPRPRSSGRAAADAAGMAAGIGGVALLASQLSGPKRPAALTESGNPADLQDSPVPGSAMPFDEEVLGGMSQADIMRPLEPAPQRSAGPPQAASASPFLPIDDPNDVPPFLNARLQTDEYLRKAMEAFGSPKVKWPYNTGPDEDSVRTEYARRFGEPLVDAGNPADLQDDPVSGSAMPFDEEVLGGMSQADIMRPIGEPQRRSPRPPATPKPAAVANAGTPAVSAASPSVAAATTPMPQLIVSGRSAPTGPTTVPTMSLADPNLAAAATPLTPDPEVAESEDSYRRRLLAAGFGPRDVDMIAAHDARQHGGMRFLQDDDALTAAAGRVNATRARDAAFDASQAEARGHNYAGPAAPSSTVRVGGFTLPSVLGSDGKPLGDGQYYNNGQLMAAQRAEEEAFSRAGGRRGVPGPRTADGRPVQPGPEFATPEEAAAYHVRPRNPETGELMPSEADKAMAARAFVPTYKSDGGVAYQMGFPTATGAGPDVRRQLEHHTSRVVPGTNLPMWEQQAISDAPAGPVIALVPSQAMRDYQAKQSDTALRARLIEAAGMREDAETAKLSLDELRAAVRNAKAEDLRERRQRFSDMARLAGGSQGIRGGVGGNVGMLQALAMLQGVDPNRMDARQRNLQFGLPGGREAAAVDAAHNQQLTDLGNRVATGRGFQQLPPGMAAAQEEALRQKVDEGKSALRKAQEAAASGRLNDESIMQHAASIVDTNYSSPALGANTSPFTDNEVELASQHLADDLDIDIDAARNVMRRIQSERNRRGVVGGFFNPYAYFN